MKIFDIITELEKFAPLSYQESYDNSGLLVGNTQSEISQILISLDCTEKVIDEAIQRNCNLVISHHPIIFKGLKKITGNTYIERTIIKAIKNDIAIYAIHTNLDNVLGGVNFKIAEILGLENVQILAPKSQILKKLTVFVPLKNTEEVASKLYNAGAGQIGNYKNCSFKSSGIGTFQPNSSANPFLGQINNTETVKEDKLEVIFPSFLEKKIILEMKKAHPYEEVAYYLEILENENQEVGSGAVGILKIKDTNYSVYEHIKKAFNLTFLKRTETTFEINNDLKIAVCGGSGVFLLSQAIKQKADIFITSDVKYHEFFDADSKITLIDIGHYESEQFTKELLFDIINKKFINIAVLLSNSVTNPVIYN
ncbi:MAG: Nif3-like dinuclear metal center hexameric protein [Cytophagales bacterium]|nr:MAG: Nif3-like dinuclear metal center hexameric protein [Cytophagales bacterium]